MTLQEMIDEEKKDSFEEGVEQGRAEGEATLAREKQYIAEKMRAKGMSEDDIAEIIGQVQVADFTCRKMKMQISV